MAQNSELSVLREASFGYGVAEDEIGDLSRYFVETDVWNSVFKGDIDLIYGAKGSGKSAIYNLLLDHHKALYCRKILAVPGENPLGAPAFSIFNEEISKGETKQQRHDRLVFIWKLYVLSICVHSLRKYQLNFTDSARKLTKIMEEAGLVETEFTLAKALRRAFDYCKRLIPMEVSAGINPYIHTFSVSAKIFPREPPSSLATAGMLNVNDLLTQANLSFQESGDYSLWVLLDRLDAAFDHAPRSVERDTLAALFRCYMDLKVHNHISMKILLRSDVFRRVTMKGYRELSHLERRTNLEWKSHMLLNLMLRRILSNVCICSFMDVDRDRVLADFDKQQAFFYRVFPKTIGGSNTLEWLFARTTDASNETAPRELIQFLNELKTMQIRRFEVGAKLARRDGMLFSEEAFREALRPVSNNRLENTLYAEYSELRHRIRPLAQGKIEYKVGDLTRIWGVDDKKAVKIAKQLENVGFFEKLPSRSARQSAHWRIPLLYRPALSLNGY